MPEISVWAPRAHSVTLDTSVGRFTMSRLAGGWWSCATPGDGPIDYAFMLDGGDPVPDPRSPWQPEGVHKRSRTVDHADYRWTDAGWQAPPLESAIIYELHIGTFTPEGTFDAAIRRIPHLLELGVTHVELMPVVEFPGDRGWGYDGVDLYAPHHAYGGPAGLKRLVDALHANGLAAVIDVVYNHFGPTGNYLARFGPYFTPEIHTPWGDAVNLGGQDSMEVRRFFVDNALMWLRDYHFDGLRLDAVHALVDPSRTHFLEELALAVRQLERKSGRRLVVTAESDLNDPRIVEARESGGYGLDAQWTDDFHHALHAVLTGERSGYYGDFGSLAHLAKAIERGFVYDGCWSAYRGCLHGRPLQADEARRLIGALQNHDQIGNRARGERIAELAGFELARIGVAVLMMSRFVPLLFQGEEWGTERPFQYFTDHRDPELGRLVSEGRRSEFRAFGWNPEDVPDPQNPATFLRSRLNWDELSREPYSGMFAWYRALIALRRALPDLRNAPARVDLDEARRRLRIHRGAVSLAVNLGNMPWDEAGPAGYRTLLASDAAAQQQPVILPPRSAVLMGDPAAASVRDILERRGAAAVG